MATRDQLDDWSAVHAMWLRRVASHPMLEVVVMLFELDLARLDKELRDPSVHPTFDEDLDAVIENRKRALLSGRSAA